MPAPHPSSCPPTLCAAGLSAGAGAWWAQLSTSPHPGKLFRRPTFCRPTHGFRAHLQCSRCPLLCRSKRMEVGAKLSLIQQLGVVPVCARWRAGLPAVDEEPELAVKYAR